MSGNDLLMSSSKRHHNGNHGEKKFPMNVNLIVDGTETLIKWHNGNTGTSFFGPQNQPDLTKDSRPCARKESTEKCFALKVRKKSRAEKTRKSIHLARPSLLRLSSCSISNMASTPSYDSACILSPQKRQEALSHCFRTLPCTAQHLSTCKLVLMRNKDTSNVPQRSLKRSVF